MVDESSTRYSFRSKALADDTFEVIQIQGEEGISRLYRFEVDLVSEDPEIDFQAVLGSPATLEWSRQNADPVATHGILSAFEQRQKGTHKIHYRAVLVPHLWLLGLRHQSQIYQDQSVKEIIEAALTAAGLSHDRFDLRLSRSYPKREYVVQYQETDLNFVSRLMEHEGIFYFFEQGEDGETLVIADGNTSFRPIPDEDKIPFRTAAMSSARQESIETLSCIQRRLPEQVILKDYNYRKPGLDLKTQTRIHEQGEGPVYEYGAHYKDPDEGRTLAGIRSEELRAVQSVFSGRGDCAAFRAGCKFTLEDHYRSDFDQEYVITRVTHRGWQPTAEVDGLTIEPLFGGLGSTDAQKAGPEPSGPRSGKGYSNEFVAIPSKVPFRPERTAKKPRLHGLMNAKVDAAGDGKYAELDDQGRYKLVMPFDLSGKGGGKASRYMRMAQPYAGPDYGTHLPLHKDAEVVWACIDGDLDRPIICGAVPNPDNASPVTDQNQTRSVIRTAGGNEIALEDEEKAEEIYVHAVRDLNTVVDNDESRKVAQTRSTTIGKDDNLTVKQHRTVHVDKGHDTLVVHEGHQGYSVMSGHCTLDVQKGNRDVTVPAGAYQLKAKNIRLTASSSIEIVCGGGSIKMDASGTITIDGVNVKLVGSTLNDIRGALVKINS